MRTRLRLVATLIGALLGTLALASAAAAHGRHHHDGGPVPGHHEHHELSGYGYGEGPEAPHVGRALKLSVSPSGTPGAPCTRKQPCKTIAEALSKATRGSTITVLGGEYGEEVPVTLKLKLIGVGLPTINALGHHNGVKLAGPGTAGSLVKGFKIAHASEEGILALSTKHVTIEGNEVRENDLGNKVATPEGQCAPEGEVPGDCGEAIHLMGTSFSKVAGNLVLGNAGGILLTDETGPTAHNEIAHNNAVGNIEDCGITLAGHNPEAFVGGQDAADEGRASSTTGSSTTCRSQTASSARAQASCSPRPCRGGGVYDNFVKGNSAGENGLPGITLHSHAPGQDLNGNKFLDNELSNNGKTGDMGKPGDAGTGLEATAGIDHLQRRHAARRHRREGQQDQQGALRHLDEERAAHQRCGEHVHRSRSAPLPVLGGGRTCDESRAPFDRRAPEPVAARPRPSPPPVSLGAIQAPVDASCATLKPMLDTAQVCQRQRASAARCLARESRRAREKNAVQGACARARLMPPRAGRGFSSPAARKRPRRGRPYGPYGRQDRCHPRVRGV